MTDAIRPMPRVYGEAKPFWDSCREQRLRLQRCASCQTWRFPPGLVCRHCSSTEAEWIEVSGRGSIHSLTVVHRTPITAFIEELPYTLALVDLDEGVRLMARISGASVTPPIGTRVEVVFEHIHDDVTLPTFREVISNDG